MRSVLSRLDQSPDQMKKRLVTRVDDRRAVEWRTQHFSFMGHDRPRPIWRAARPLLVFAAAYVAAWSYLFIAAFLGAQPPPAPLFPPGAVLFCALLLVPPRRWWGLLLVAFLIQVPILAYLHLPLWWNVAGIIPDALEPIVAASLIRRFIPLPLRFASLREVSVFTGCAAAGVLCGATVGSVVNAAGGEPYWTSWETWSLGDLLSCLLLTPTLLLWIDVGFRGLRAESRWRYAEGALLYGGLLVMGLVVFDTRLLGPDTARALIYLPVPLLLWAAVRFGPRGIATALTLLVVLAVPAVANATGPFASQSSPSAATLGNVFTLQLFLLVIGVPLFFLAALMQERQAARTEAERQAEQLDRIFEQTAEGLTVYDAAGRQVRSNAAQRRLLGLDAAPPGYDQQPLAELAIGYQARDLDGRPLPADRLPVARALHGEVIGGTDAMDMQVRTWNGRELDISASAAPLRVRDGRIIGVVGVFRDQTQRMQLEREMAEQAEQLDRIVEAMGEGLFVYDTQGQVVRTNAAARHLLGLDAAPPEFSRLSAEERLALYAPRDQQGHLLTPQTWLSFRTERDGEALRETEARDIRMRALDGRELEVSATIAPLRNVDGQITGAVLLLSDRTERNQLAREREEAQARELALREVNQRLDTFASVAAHDLRSPVAASRLAAQVARRTLNRATARPETGTRDEALARVAAALETTEQSLDRLRRLEDQLLDVARVREGTLALHCRPVNLAELARGCVEEQRLLNPARTIELGLPEPDAPPVIVDADAVRLEQVLTNYLTNALRYSPEGRPIEVTLRVAEEAAEGSAKGSYPTTRVEDVEGTAGVAERTERGRWRKVARVEVRDHGPGIPPEEQATIWDRFQRAQSVAEVSGLGLGLYIARMVVEQHGGRVGVTSTVGQGSTFWFTVPQGNAPTTGDIPKVPPAGPEEVS